jgi:transcriptional regulator with XRE-family HTH domain
LDFGAGQGVWGTRRELCMSRSMLTGNSAFMLVMAAACLRLAENMKRSRAESAMSLHAVADSAAVERKYLRHLESAKLNPSLKTLERVARALGVSVVSLIGPAGPSTSPSLFSANTLVALNVKRLRRERRWSAADAGERICMKAKYLSFVETGKGNLTLQTLCTIAAGFGVDVVELLSTDGERAHKLAQAALCDPAVSTPRRSKKPL